MQLAHCHQCLPMLAPHHQPGQVDHQIKQIKQNIQKNTIKKKAPPTKHHKGIGAFPPTWMSQEVSKGL